MAEAFKCDRCGGLVDGKPSTGRALTEEIEGFHVNIAVEKQLTEAEAEARVHSYAGFFFTTEAHEGPYYGKADFCRPCLNELLIKALRLREMQAIGESLAEGGDA